MGGGGVAFPGGAVVPSAEGAVVEVPSPGDDVDAGAHHHLFQSLDVVPGGPEFLHGAFPEFVRVGLDALRVERLHVFEQQFGVVEFLHDRVHGDGLLRFAHGVPS